MDKFVYDPKAVGDEHENLSTIFSNARLMARSAGHPVRVNLHEIEVS